MTLWTLTADKESGGKVAIAGSEPDILDFTPENDIEDEILQADEVKEQIYQALSQLEDTLKPIPHPPRTRVDPTIADPTGTSGTGSSSGTSGTGPLASAGPSTGTLGPASSVASHSGLGAKVKLQNVSIFREPGGSIGTNFGSKANSDF